MPPVLQEPAGAEQAATRSSTNDDPMADAPPRELSQDDIFDVLRVRRRREVLSYLDGHGGEATLGTLAVQAAAAENGIEPEAVTAAQRKRVYIALYQCHLPKLADLGVVEYDGRGPVRLRPPARRVLPYLYFDPADEVSGRDRSTGAIGFIRRWLNRHLAG